MDIVCPVVNELSSDNKNKINFAISSGCAALFIGINLILDFRFFPIFYVVLYL